MEKYNRYAIENIVASNKIEETNPNYCDQIYDNIFDWARDEMNIFDRFNNKRTIYNAYDYSAGKLRIMYTIKQLSERYKINISNIRNGIYDIHEIYLYGFPED
jgi:hypothetical protein